MYRRISPTVNILVNVAWLFVVSAKQLVKRVVMSFGPPIRGFIVNAANDGVKWIRGRRVTAEYAQSYELFKESIELFLGERNTLFTVRTGGRLPRGRLHARLDEASDNGLFRPLAGRQHGVEHRIRLVVDHNF